MKTIRQIWHAGASEALRQVLLDLLCLYFRAELRGLQQIPRKGAALLIANHSGWAALDAVILAHLVHRYTQRRPRVMAHRAYFDWFPPLRRLSFRVGLREPHLECALKTLRHGHLLIVFPEGERGNFKSSLKRYQVQKFHSGFAFLARRAKVPVVPCVITGNEEAFYNLGSLNLEWLIRTLRVPLPLNLIPFPVKVRVRIGRHLNRAELAGPDAAERIRGKLQAVLDQARRAAS